MRKFRWTEFGIIKSKFHPARVGQVYYLMVCFST